METLSYSELKTKALQLGIKGNIKREELEKLVAEKETHSCNKEAGEDCSSCPSEIESLNTKTVAEPNPLQQVVATGAITPPPPKKKVVLKPDRIEYKQGDLVQDTRTGEKFIVEFVTGSKEIARRINMTEKGLKFYSPEVLRLFKSA